MTAQLFKGLFDTELTSVISIADFLLCVGAALLLGLVLTLSYMYKSRYTKSFLLTLGLLPAVVAVVIMMVNGNVGAGVAVAGAFSLVRFRSVPGSAKEICTLFLAMGTGLITGMGYLAFAAVFTVIMCLVLIIYNRATLISTGKASLYKSLRITVPEDLDYPGVFDGILSEYCTSYELTNVKTTNMGSMFRLTYELIMKADVNEKELIDKLRIRNGNLEITISKQSTINPEL